VTDGYTTIVTPIRDGHIEELKRYLRTVVDPVIDQKTVLRCDGFPFHRMEGLHFCSFIVLDEVVLDEGPGFPASLVFEATFDGSRDFFLDALMHFAPHQMHEIYRHCEGYPESGLAAAQLVKDYLAYRDVGAQTFFRGSPGRTIAQIRGEARIYDAIRDFVTRRWQSRKTMPATFAGLQQELQQKIRCGQPDLRWAEQMAAVPWEVSARGMVAGVVVVLMAVFAASVGAIVFGLFGIGAGHVSQWPNVVRHLGVWILSESDFTVMRDLANAMHINLPVPLFVLAAFWIAFRLLQVPLEIADSDPRQKLFGYASLWLRFSVRILTILGYACVVAFVGFAAIMLDRESNPNQDPEFNKWLLGLSPTRSALLLVGVVCVWALFRYRETSLQLRVQFQQLPWGAESWRRLRLDVLRVGRVVLLVSALLLIRRWMPDGLNAFFVNNVLPPMLALVVVAFYVLTGLFVFYALWLGLSVVIGFMEYRDRRRFANAEELTTRDNSSVYAREEGGTNTYQNHLASLTYVKPGFRRMLLLRATLFFIGLLSRFWFNIGELGGIPTILSARWVLIDGGKRLLFLDHYGGAWDSYLNEFIDMAAVKGLNAIWTNTFIRAEDNKYSFPETDYYLWKGAQVERSFKAYVRHSQIETIVWYSAYPTLATVTINANTKLRQSLFKTLPSCDIDTLFQDL
jgi:hypothetical protein